MNIRFYQFMATATALVSLNTFAVTNTYFTSVNNSATSLESFSLKGFSGDVEFLSNQFADDVGEVTGNKFHGDLNLKYQTEESQNRFEKKFEFKARVNDNSNLMFSVPEASLKTTMSQGELSFGRVILPWSKSDANWGFGKLNNRVNFDGFTPGQEGLVGARYVHKFTKNLRVEGFASYTYVPELNPGLKVDKDKGTVECNNPWCNAPSSSTDIGGSDVPIYYNVNYPEIDEVVFKPSAGVRLDWDINIVNISAFFTRKPENTISTSVEVTYENANQRVFADITPEVYYHNVFGGDLTVKINEELSLNGTALAIRPDGNPDTKGKVVEYLDIKPNKIDEEYIGGGAQYNNGQFVTALNYIARVSRFKKTDDPLLQYPRWNQAFHFNIGSKLSRKLSLALDYKYDTLTEDRLTMFKASYLLSPSLITSLGVNMIGAAKGGDSYWAKFKNNDALYGSLKYTF